MIDSIEMYLLVHILLQVHMSCQVLVVSSADRDWCPRRRPLGLNDTGED